MTPQEKEILVERMHVACKKVRYAIAVIEADVPEEESTVNRLSEAIDELAAVREVLSR